MTASGVGIIIGAGVYVLIGSATALAGPRVWMAFVAAALLSALTGISHAELASMYPSVGRVRVHPRAHKVKVPWPLVPVADNDARPWNRNARR